jgi:uncharacterized membrane protein YhaH (DUF805 family)
MEKFNRYFLNTIKYHYADFQGRASRSEFWYFFLFYILLAFAMELLDALVINPLLGVQSSHGFKGGVLSAIYGLILFIPYLAIGVRRLHDIGKSGWWMLVGLVPFLGALVLIYFMVQPSKDHSD